MKTKLLIVLSVISLHVFGQEFAQEINIDSLDIYTPEGYAILDSSFGDLNRDEYKDLLIVFNRVDESDISDVIDNPADRPLLIYTGNEDGILNLAARSDKVVLCVDCGGVWGDPYEGMVIKKGYFTLEHYGGSNWRWTRYITFKYSEEDAKWYLHKDGGDSYHSGDPENVETILKTVKDFGIVEFEKFEY